VRCRFCGGEIEAGVKKCKHCGEWLIAREFRWTFWVLLILGVLIVGGGITAATFAEVNYAAKTYGNPPR
jgi:hypothetical protein